MQDFSDSFSDYLDYCRNFLRLSPCTIKGMESSKSVFLEYFDDLPIDSYRIEDILNYSEWISHRQGRNGHYSKSSMAQRMTHLKKFFEWCEVRRGYKVLNWRLIRVPQNRKRRLEFLSQKEFHYLVRKLRVRGFTSLRLKASLFVLASTGCRASELCNMKLKDIDLHKGEIFIRRGKGGKPGVVFLNSDARAWLIRYLAARKLYGDCCDWVWIVKGQGCSRLTEQNLYYQIKGYGESIHFHKKLYPHIFRHTFATDLLKNGANIREVQELLRHSSLESTMVYTHVTNPDLHKAHKKYLKMTVTLLLLITSLFQTLPSWRSGDEEPAGVAPETGEVYKAN